MAYVSYFKNIFFALLFLQLAFSLSGDIKKAYNEYAQPRTKVGLVPVKGMLVDSSFYTKALTTFFKDENIKAIVLKIESPGGAAGTSNALNNEIIELKKQFPKPVITLVENMCTSGAYEIACATDYIIAPASSIIGSIGTALPHQFQLKDFIEQFKIRQVTLKAGKYKAVGDPFSIMTPDNEQFLQNVLQDAYGHFIATVANQRNLSLAQQEEWAEGKIFTGQQALSHKLIDEIGSFHTCVGHLKQVLALDHDRIKWVKPSMPSKFQRLFGMDDDGLDDESIDMYASSFITTLCKTLEQRYSSLTIS